MKGKYVNDLVALFRATTHDEVDVIASRLPERVLAIEWVQMIINSSYGRLEDAQDEALRFLIADLLYLYGVEED